jgi:hypothetical protein
VGRHRHDLSGATFEPSVLFFVFPTSYPVTLGNVTQRM